MKVMKNFVKNAQEEDVLTKAKYICKITSIVTESLQKGCDVAQLPNGDIIVSEVKTVNTHYTWDKNKQRMVRSSSI